LNTFGAIVRRARIVAPLTVFALVASGLAALPSDRAVAAPRSEASTADVKVADDFVSARIDALAQGHRVEALSLRTETSQTFVDSNGQVTRVIATAPVRVRDASSADGWRTVDLTLTRQPDGSFAPRSTVDEVRLSGGDAKDAQGLLASLISGARSVSLDWAGTLPVPSINGATATYENVKPGVDLKVEVTRTGIEQFFVLKERPAPGDESTLALPVSANGVVVADAADGEGQTIETNSGEPVGSISSAVTWGASTKRGAPDQVTTSPSEIKTIDGQRSLVITPDIDFLQSADTAYPVTIDPSVTLSGSSVTDAYIKSSSPDSNYGSSSQLYVGSNDGGSTKYRSLVTVATGAAMQGATVTSATLGLWESNASSCTASPVTAYGFPTRRYAVNQTWNNQPAVDPAQLTTVTTAKGFSSSCAADWVNFDVANQLQYSLNAAYEVMTVALQADESSNSGWKSFDSAEGTHVPTLTVTYNLPPAKPLMPAVSAGTTGAAKVYTSALTPSFSATSADPESDKVKMTFSVYNSASPLDTTTFVSSCTTALAPSGTSESCTPSGALTDGTAYWVRALATDASGSTSQWSQTLYFATAAATPTAPTISCATPYGDGSWAASPPSAAVSCSVSVPGNYKGIGPKQILVSLDGANNTVTPVADTGTTTATISIPNTAGVHTLTASTVSGAQLSSNTVTYRFGYGSPGLATPNTGLKTLGPVKVSAYAPFRGTAAAVSASLQWRISGASGTTTGWNSVSTADVTPPSSSTSPFFSKMWDSTTATSDASVTPAVALSARQNTLLDVRVCFTYDTGTPQCTTDAGTITTVLRVPSAFSDGFPTATAGEGSVALTTGEFSEDVSDVNLTTNTGSLSIGRTHSTFATSASTGIASGVFGPGWSADFAGGDAGSASLIVDDQTATSGALNFTDPSGTVLAYSTPNGLKSATPTGSYVPVDDTTRQANETVAVAGSGSSKTLTTTDVGGNVTTWKQATSGSTTSWVPVSAAEAGQQGTTSSTTDSSGRVTRILAPVPDGVTCPATGTLNPGCSWLRLTYATSTTATSGTLGDYLGQLKGVYYNNYDPAAAALSEIKVAGYTYDNSGRLAVESNPTNSATKTYQYATYNGFTALTQSSSSGFAPYTYSYTTTGGNVRLANVTRGAAVSGGSDVVLSSYVYNASLGSAGPDLSAAQIAKWGQTRTPTAAYAVFGLDHPVTGAPSSSDWPYAQLYFTDSAGYTVNTSTYGAGEWLTTATNYDSTGAVTTSLGAMDLALAVVNNTAGIAFDPNANSTITRYLPAVAGSSPGTPLVATDSIPQDTWSAPFTTVLQNGTTEQVRTHSHYTYDEGAPAGDVNAATGKPYLLATTVSVGVAGVSDTSTDPATMLPIDVETSSVTKYGYDPNDGASTMGATSGWTLGLATVTTTVMPNSNDNVVHKVRYDASGNVVADGEPGSNGSDAGTTLTVTYTSASNSQDSACGGHPEWAGLTCSSGPAAEPETGVDIPDARTTYNRWLEPLTVTETSGSGSAQSTRTTTNTYLTDGRLNTVGVTASGLTTSAAVLKKKTSYSSAALIGTGTQALNPDGSIATQDVATFDLWGRMTKYFDTAGDNTNYNYIVAGSAGAGQVASIATSKGTSSYTYDGTDANGEVEHRGLATGLSVSGIGSFAAAYDTNGSLTTQILPGAMTQSYSYDNQGRPIGLTYTGDVVIGGTTARGVLLAYGRIYNSSGQAAYDWSPAGSSTQPGGYTQGYTYDRAHRLVQVQDATGNSANGSHLCTTRSYSFDVRGNRTSLNTAPSSDCTTIGGSSASYAYDAYSRALTGANGVGSYTYDAFGRQTVVPAADAPGGSNSAITIGYYDTDAVATLTQGSTTTTYTLDAAGRRFTEASNIAGVAATTTDYYVRNDDSPAWVAQVAGSTTTTSTYARGLGNGMAAEVTTVGSVTAKTLELSNLSGSSVASVTIPATGNATLIAGFATYDEFGNAEAPVTTVTGVDTYGWLGSAQREVGGANLVLMGMRLYSSVVGRFTSRDPVVGGNENAYDYPDDPINHLDPTGATYVDRIEWHRKSPKYNGHDSLNIFLTSKGRFTPDPFDKVLFATWKEVVRKGGPGTNTASMYYQFACHWVLPPVRMFKPHIDIEPARKLKSWPNGYINLTDQCNPAFK
jgi:RHS repeat-associated protein